MCRVCAVYEVECVRLGCDVQFSCGLGFFVACDWCLCEVTDFICADVERLLGGWLYKETLGFEGTARWVSEVRWNRDSRIKAKSEK